MPILEEVPATLDLDLESEEVRSGLAKILSNLFDKWDLSNKEKCSLLGLSESSRSLLKGYAEGKPLPKSRDVLDRAGLLLSIHKSLRLLYPRNEGLRYSFVKTPDEMLNNLRPLDVMEREGLIGIAKISRYLDSERGQ